MPQMDFSKLQQQKILCFKDEDHASKFHQIQGQNTQIPGIISLDEEICLLKARYLREESTHLKKNISSTNSWT